MRRVKKGLAMLLCAGMLSAQLPVAAASASVTVAVDGQALPIDAYINSDARTMVPASAAEALGIDYAVSGNTVQFSRLGETATYEVGAPLGDTAPALVNSTLYVPLWKLAEDFGYQLAWSGADTTARLTTNYPAVAVDVANRGEYAAQETAVQTEFDWYTWTFELDPALDTVGVTGDGLGMLRFRLYVPQGAEAGVQYPLVATLGGLGSTNAFQNNGYAQKGASFASEVNQASNPCYVLNITVPYEACVNFEAEMEYINQFGQIIRAVAAAYGNVDMNRIYATGNSQGAGWSYELAAAQPDLLAAILINAGTTIHTTWGNQCDLQAIADSGVNTYIWHGYNDPYIPVNEAYRAYNILTKLGMTNVLLDIDQGGHCLGTMLSPEGFTPYMEWLFHQQKGVPFTEAPIVQIEGTPATDYDWAGFRVMKDTDGWTSAYDFTTRVESAEHTVWNRVVQDCAANLAAGAGGAGKTWLSKVRIGDETATSYDDATSEVPVVTIGAGDTVAVTIQGYTGGYGDDWDAFQKEWDVDWAVLEGSVTNIELTNAASETPILRPESVSLANGGGPNVNNSLYNENALDGRQVYVKIDTAENFQGDTLKVAIRFTRDLGNGEYASYWHVIQYNVNG